MTSIKNKVLFIGIGFYDYDKIIKKEIEKLGYKVDYYKETEELTGFSRFKKKYSKSNNGLFVNKSDYIAEECSNDYKIIFSIKCCHLTNRALERIKHKNPDAKFILYLWDSLERIENIKSKLNYFHKIYSFDRFDCIENQNLVLKPLFYRKEFEKMGSENNFTFDIFHLGWFHSDRLTIIWKINKFCKKNNINQKLILFTGLFNFFKLIVNNAIARKMYNSFIFKPLSFKDNIALIQKSKIILDINHPQQTGLTMRTIEILATGRKLITTNKDIINYDFYNSSNILIIDRDNPNLQLDFFLLESDEEDLKNLKKYRLDNWLKSMFDI